MEPKMLRNGGEFSLGPIFDQYFPDLGRKFFKGMNVIFDVIIFHFAMHPIEL